VINALVAPCTGQEGLRAPQPTPPSTSTLALDLGSRCGWAVGQAGQAGQAEPLRSGLICSGVWDIAPRRGESPGMRYLRLRAQLQRVHAAYPDLAAVYYEQAHHRGGAATEYALGCVASVQAWCAEHGIEHAAVHSALIKKHATGKGNAPKEALLAALRKRGLTPSDDNEADALALLDWALTQGGAT